MKNTGYILILLLAACLPILWMGCTRPSTAELPDDPTSLANFRDVIIEHLDLDLTVDFSARTLSGTAVLHLDNITGTDRLILDTQDLIIQRVTRGEESAPVDYRLGEAVQYYGRPFIIPITPETERVTVEYTTSPDAPALQWVVPEQTASKSSPLLYSQSQFILARSWIPCQDTPAVRMTYSAVIRTSPEYLAVMSAINPQSKNNSGVYHFKMPQPIPSYLLALGVGDLEFEEIGPRSGVYAEPPVVDRAAWEFAETEQMIRVAEKLYGPYLWERYDMLILPPSFPFGGMENPRLTFVTPTILGGDRSLVDLIAHELAHSWSGNLVTNATWNDFWLNEGFTVYFEHRIMESIRGKRFAEMLSELSYHDLEQTVEELGPDNPDTALKPDLAGRDPEAAYSSIPYVKGFFFLKMLEEQFGRETWDHFLGMYFQQFRFRSVSTEQFEEYLTGTLLRNDQQLKEELRIDEWLYRPGIPGNIPVVESGELTRVERAAGSFTNGGNPARIDTTGWTSHHYIHFLQQLPDSLGVDRLKALDDTFGFTTTDDTPLLRVWLPLAIRSGYQPAFPRMETFLTSVGRVYLIEPVYTALAQTEHGLQEARRIYREAQPLYHAMARNAIERVLETSG
ncbi:MAG TPA: leukotriene A4 hydrolase C-terminal domain-containing protein [bacterium]|nr:leukotriene A4 hydrolase C-terminal domain-containing protein [bacterium]